HEVATLSIEPVYPTRRVEAQPTAGLKSENAGAWHLEQRGASPPRIAFDKAGAIETLYKVKSNRAATGGTTMGANSHRHVLDGYKVLDFTQIVAGPTCTLMLAEMGAEVIKLELAPAGDPARGAQVLVNGRSGYFVQHNRGKKGLCIDVKTPEGVAVARELVRKVDVVVENFSPGTIGCLGLSYDNVKELNPRAVMCSISA